MIFPCSCKNEYQDLRYGQGRRVGNVVTGSSSQNIVLRCTSCKNEYFTEINSSGKKKVGERKTRFWFETAKSVSKRFVSLCRYKRS